MLEQGHSLGGSEGKGDPRAAADLEAAKGKIQVLNDQIEVLTKAKEFATEALTTERFNSGEKMTALEDDIDALRDERSQP
jgi:hypothetical protein